MKFSIYILSTLFLFSGVLQAKTIRIGTKETTTSIQKGILLAKNGDTLLVQPGTYREGNIIIAKNIKLFGKNNPVLDGEDRHEILTISGEDIVIRGIHFKNAGYSSMNDYAAFKVIDARRVVVENNTFNNSYFAIHFANTQYSAVRNNRITGNNKSEQLSGNGIHLWKCDNMMIERNEISAHRDGIYFEFVTASTIYRNISDGNVRPMARR